VGWLGSSWDGLFVGGVVVVCWGGGVLGVGEGWWGQVSCVKPREKKLFRAEETVVNRKQKIRRKEEMSSGDLSASSHRCETVVPMTYAPQGRSAGCPESRGRGQTMLNRGKPFKEPSRWV